MDTLTNTPKLSLSLIRIRSWCFYYYYYYYYYYYLCFVLPSVCILPLVCSLQSAFYPWSAVCSCTSLLTFVLFCFVLFFTIDQNNNELLLHLLLPEVTSFHH